jgi:hypothetical protein
MEESKPVSIAAESGKSPKPTGIKTGVTAASLKKLKQWTIVEVGWLDIVEDNTGDPQKSHIVKRNTLGRIWGVKRYDGVYVLTLTFTQDPDGPEQAGWICIPCSVIRTVEVIRDAI